jgi:adenine-specific DNA-methyltransferase
MTRESEALTLAYRRVIELVENFSVHEEKFLGHSYSEAQARVDFIDPLFEALGWDVNHKTQRNPFEQEVLVERNVATGQGQKRADYAFFLTPNYRDVRFFVEAKKPSVQLSSDLDGLFQTIRYAWNANTPIAILTNFNETVIVDCRSQPDPATAARRILLSIPHRALSDLEQFSKLYWLFSREALFSGSYDRFCESLPKPRGPARQLRLFKHSDQAVDNAFLNDLLEYRARLASNFKRQQPNLDSDALTEITQRVIDRIVFLRFLEDKLIETKVKVSQFGISGSSWADFVAASRRLDAIYNGIVFKEHPVIDRLDFLPDDSVFSEICDELSDTNSPYDFNAIPIHILGSIYELFLGKIIVATEKRARIEDKPEVRKAGGVYYTPAFIVDNVVGNTVGLKLRGKTPKQIAKLRVVDIACGSGSFLLGVYDCVLRYVTKWYNENPEAARRDGCALGDDGFWWLTLHQRRAILINNIFGVDIDPQAVEVTQLSLYLKLLENETTSSTYKHQLEFEETVLPPLNKNIVWGNSLVEPDLLHRMMCPPEEERAINPLAIRRQRWSRFPGQNGGLAKVDSGFDYAANFSCSWSIA